MPPIDLISPMLQAGTLRQPAEPMRLKTSAFQQSPIQERNALAWAALQQGRYATNRVEPPLASQPSPGYSRGVHVLHDGPGLLVYTELGPMMWNRTLRGERLGRHLDVQA